MTKSVKWVTFLPFVFIADPNAYGKTVEYTIQVFIDNNRLEN